MQGWVKKYRQVYEHPLFDDEPFSKRDAFEYLICKAAFEETKQIANGKMILVKRGELVTSERFLSGIFMWSKTKVRQFLDILESEKMISKTLIRGKTRLNIVNYDKYQDTETTEKPEKNQKKTTEKPLNKNVKNEKKEEEEEENDFKVYGYYGNVFLSEQQYQTLLCEIIHKPALLEVLEDLSQKIAEKKELEFDGKGNHFARVRAFWRHRRKNPRQTKTEETTEWNLMG